MKNLLKLSYLRNFAWVLVLALVSMNTVFAMSSGVKKTDVNSSLSYPRICTYFYEETVNPYDYVWDCNGCVKVYSVISSDTLPFGCEGSALN